MDLKKIYKPIQKELDCAEAVLNDSLEKTKSRTILEINRYLLESPGKRIRPALVLLSAKATVPDASPISQSQLSRIAGAIELIHMASLMHDDVIDHSKLRHSKSTVSDKWGSEVSIALGDYLYSEAFELIAQCGNTDILRCITSATKAMCEGELLQVCERGNIDLLKERYFVIVKKKTAALFAASCQVGALVSDSQKSQQLALKEYGMNFGIAFQIIDDYLDLVSDEKTLGKSTGQDIHVGEVTLPVLNTLECAPAGERKEMRRLLTSERNQEFLHKTRSQLFHSEASLKTKESVVSFVNIAKKKIDALVDSPYTESLRHLADSIITRGFDGTV